MLYLVSYSHHYKKSGRGREIRTPDILLPKQARYQTALYPDYSVRKPARLTRFQERESYPRTRGASIRFDSRD